MKKIKTINLFGGIGADTQALKRVFGKGNVEIVDYVELDKHAVKSYNAINGTNFVPTDVNDIDMSAYPEVDLVVAGWPCQDYSIAGKGLGLEGTRSNLILLTISKIKEMVNKPKYILLENVKGLLSKKHEADLAYIKELFSELGYEWDQALLNSKFFGVPQARERVFMLLTRKDLPKKTIKQLEKRNTVDKILADILNFGEPTEKVSIKDTINGKTYFVNKMSQYNGKIIELDLNKLENQNKETINKIATLGTFENDSFKEHSVNQVKNFTGIKGQYQTFTNNNGTGNQIIFKDVSFNQDKSIHGIKGQAPTLTTSGTDFKAKIAYGDETQIHYRKLATLETWRLMGFSDEAHNKVKSLMEYTKSGKEKRSISDSQLNKQAGNSIVVNVLEAIFEEIFSNYIT